MGDGREQGRGSLKFSSSSSVHPGRHGHGCKTLSVHINIYRRCLPQLFGLTSRNGRDEVFRENKFPASLLSRLRLNICLPKAASLCSLALLFVVPQKREALFCRGSLGERTQVWNLSSRVYSNQNAIRVSLSATESIDHRVSSQNCHEGVIKVQNATKY